MKKIKKLPWEEIDKSGWQQSGYGRSGNEVSRMILYELGPTAFAVYFIIQSHRNIDSNECFPSVQMIANECSFSKSTVEKAITALVKADYLSVNSGRQGVNNNYYFPLEDFYSGKFKDDIKQAMAYRRSIPGFKKKKTDDEFDYATHKSSFITEEIEDTINEFLDDD